MDIKRVKRGLCNRLKNYDLAFKRALWRVNSWMAMLIHKNKYSQIRLNAKPKKKVLLPTFLLLRYQYAHGDIKNGISNEYHAVTSPLLSANVCKLVELYYDVNCQSPKKGNAAFLSAIEAYEPDLVVLSSYSPGKINQPSLNFLELIKEKSGISFIHLWHDSVSLGEPGHRLLSSPLIDLHVALDSSNLIDSGVHLDKFLRLWAPIDRTIFNMAPDEPRTIGTSFLGSTSSYRDVRKPYLDHLESNGLNLFRSGGQLDNQLSLEEYAAIFMRSKISINFAFSVGSACQLKVRVFEILYSGALLMESANPETKKYFIPGQDYVEFESKEDLLKKIRYYLAHDRERLAIAKRGHEKAVSLYSHQKFWADILNNLDNKKLVQRF